MIITITVTSVNFEEGVITPAIPPTPNRFELIFSTSRIEFVKEVVVVISSPSTCPERFPAKIPIPKRFL